MKKALLSFLQIFSLVFLWQSSICCFGQTTVPTLTPPINDNPPNRPCKNIEEACKKGGYFVGGDASHQGLWSDCVNPLLNNQVITGLKVNSSDVKSCQNVMAKMPKTSVTQLQ